MTEAIVWSCAHADPKHSNERFDWLGAYIYDMKPDLVIDLGDGADMRSLNQYDTLRGTKSFVTQSYEADVKSYIDSQQRLRKLFKQNKKRKPQWVGMEGNHEHRIKTAIALDPRREGEKYGLSFGHLQTSKWFDEYHEYSHSGPAIAEYGGVDFAHFFAPNSTGRALASTHHGHALLSKRHRSSVCGHTHQRDIKFNDLAGTVGLVVGNYKGGPEDWAGQSNDLWWSGVVRLKNLSGGSFDPEFVSMKELKDEYS